MQVQVNEAPPYSRQRSISSGSLPQQVKKERYIPPLVFIPEQDKNPKRIIEATITPYNRSECLQDCKGKGIWKITHRYFPTETISEISNVLASKTMQKNAVQSTKDQLSTVLKDISEAQELKFSDEDILKLSIVRLTRITIENGAAINSKKTELDLLFCHLTNPLIEGVLGGNLKVLHLEHGILSDDLCSEIAKGLSRKNNPLRTLRLVHMKIEPLGLNSIVKGLISRNFFPKGVKNVCLVACQINEKYEMIIEELLGKSKHLEVLDLEGNELGSASAFRHKIPKTNSIISSIVKGTIQNMSNIGNLKMISLADNQLTSKDRDLLETEEGIRGNPRVIFNIGGNHLWAGKQTARKQTGRLSYESPRPIALEPIDILRSPKVKVSPRAGSISPSRKSSQKPTAEVEESTTESKPDSPRIILQKPTGELEDIETGSKTISPRKTSILLEEGKGTKSTPSTPKRVSITPSSKSKFEEVNNETK